MVYQAFNKQNKFFYRIKGQRRPFIDENLQLHFPGIEPLIDQSQPPCTSHYIHVYYSPFCKTFYSHPLESELTQARFDTQYAYESWKEIQQKLSNSFLVIK